MARNGKMAALRRVQFWLFNRSLDSLHRKTSSFSLRRSVSSLQSTINTSLAVHVAIWVVTPSDCQRQKQQHAWMRCRKLSLQRCLINSISIQAPNNCCKKATPVSRSYVILNWLIRFLLSPLTFSSVVHPGSDSDGRLWLILPGDCECFFFPNSIGKQAPSMIIY